MLKNLITKIKKKIKIFGLVLLIFLTAISISYFDSKKKESIGVYGNFIDNIYFKKTLSHIVENLEPKYKKIIYDHFQANRQYDQLYDPTLQRFVQYGSR